MTRQGLVRRFLGSLRQALSGSSTSTRRRATPSGGRPAPPGGVTATDVGRDLSDDDLRFEYSPRLDGDADPGEVVWTWVPYEDDPSQGKDRPVAVIGRRGRNLLGVPLTSKQKLNEVQVPVGAGPWDREGRQSYAKVERVLEIVPERVRREGAVLARNHFDDVVEGVRRVRR